MTTPPLHDPARTPTPAAAQRAERRARRDEIERINNANEYDIGSIGNYDPDEG